MKLMLSNRYSAVLLIIAFFSSVFSFGQQPSEKIFLQTDKTTYVAGEILWFKCEVTAVNGYDSTLSTIAYVELLNANGKPIQQAKISLSKFNGDGNFYLPITVSTGVYTLVAYTSELKNIGINYFARRKIAIINTFTGNNFTPTTPVGNKKNIAFNPANQSSNIQISTDKSTYDKREEITISLMPSGLTEDDILSGAASVSYIGSGNDLKNPDMLFTEISTDSADNVNPTNNDDRKVKYIPEYDGHIISARVISNWDKKPAPNTNCVLSIPSSIPFGFYTGVSDANGIVRFNVRQYYGNGNIFIKAFPNPNPESYQFEIIDPFIDSTAWAHDNNILTLNVNDSLELLQRSIAMQANNIYYQDSLNNFQLPLFKDTLPFYGKAEYSYNLDDYKRFSTMEEVLREYVTNINVRGSASRLRMVMFDEKYAALYDQSILVLLDGVPLVNYNNIFQYDPFKVRKLDIVPSKYSYGASVYNGIASFETYNSKFDAFDLDPTSIPIPYDGLQIQRKFYMPVYTSSDKGRKHMPDMRTTLLWDPNIIFKKEEKQTVKAYTSDFNGFYKVIVQGVSKKGVPFYGEKVFEVR